MEFFNDPRFSILALTAMLNARGYTPGQIGNLDIFEEDGISVLNVALEKDEDRLTLIEPTARGGPGVAIDTSSDEEQILFALSHFEVNDSMKADEVQGARQLGTDDQLEAIEGRVEVKLARHARALDATLEHQRVGAIKGLITSSKGKVLHNLFTRFEIAMPAAIPLGIDVENPNLARTVKDNVVLPIEDDLDESYDGLHAMCGAGLHSYLWNQKAIRETWLGTNDASTLRGGIPDIFEYGKITWERYRTGRKGKAANGGAHFIADDEAHVFPTGVPELFITRFGPADYEETVNTIGLPRYARQYAFPNGKGRHLDSQMNQISLCTRPRALRTLKVAA